MILSVDPGLNAIGWAWWYARPRLEKPLLAGVISVPAKMIKKTAETWHDRIGNILYYLDHRLDTDAEKMTRLVVEWPEFRDGAVGRAAAARGNLTQLAFCCGALYTVAVAKGATFELLAVSKWKGQLPKEVVEKRIKRAIGDCDQEGSPFKSHAWDAVGIGLVAKGYKMNDADVFGKGAVCRK